jgi:hypothetical protein
MSGSSGSQSSATGMNVIQGYINELFGGGTTVSKRGQLQPSTFAQGGIFSPEMFSALPGLLQNQPLTATDTAILGPGGAQSMGWLNALGSQGILQQGANALPALLETDPKAAIAAANRGFSQDTLPAILERAPGFSSSDLQRETMRAGVDLQTNIAALKEANLGRVGQVVQGLPQFAQSYGQNLLDQASTNLGFGQIGRELTRDVSPAGDAFRVLSMMASLAGGGSSTSSGAQKSGGV